MIPFDDFAQRLDKVTRGNGYILAICPFHDDHNPSLYLNEHKRYYNCFACGEHGTLDDLWRELGNGNRGSGSTTTTVRQRKRYVTRPNWVGEELSSYCLRAHKSLQDLGKTVSWYLEDRGLGEGIQKFELGYDNGWFIVPVKSSNGSVQGAVARASPKILEMRYDMPPGQRPMLYVPDWELWNESRVVYIAFGILDAISLALAGLAAGTPTAGKGNFDPSWLDEVHKHIVLVPDRYEDGDAYELAAKLDWRGRVALLDYPPGTKDPNDLISKFGPDGLLAAVLSQTKKLNL